MPLGRAKNLETKSDEAPFEQKRLAKPFVPQLTDQKGTFSGHGAVFEDPHPTSSYLLGSEWKDVIRAGAFTRSLAEHKKRGTLPLMLYMHERGYVIGAWQSVEEDKDGLKVSGQVSPDARAPSNVSIYELLKMGGINGLSIGFRPTKVELDQEKKTRSILDVELAEISVVDIPGGPKARVTDVKAERFNPRFVENFVREGLGFSDSEAKAFIARGLGAAREVSAKDAGAQREAGAGEGSTDPEALVASLRELAKSIRSGT